MNNHIVTEVIESFQSNRINKMYQRQLLINSLPDMMQIKKRKKQLLQEVLTNSFQGTTNSMLETELLELDQREDALLKKVDFQYVCALCGDTGKVKGDYCSCLRDLIYQNVYGAANINTLTESFEKSDISRFNTGIICTGGDSQSVRYIKLENYAKKYVALFPNNKKNNLLLSGNTGLGKTYILRSIAKSLYNSGHDVFLTDAASLFGTFLRHRLGYEINLDILQNCEIFLLDDLGAEPISHNVTVEYLLDLISKRIENKKHTVIATNLLAENIQNRYGERVYSRIRFKEICDQLFFEGSDIRVK